jgi:hypothetical protein
MYKINKGDLKMKTNYYNQEFKTMNYFTECEDNDMFSNDINKMNNAVLNGFYKAVECLLNKGYEEYIELTSNTINPAQQNAFIPLRKYKIKRNGHYKIASIYQRFGGGCCIEEKAI